MIARLLSDHAQQQPQQQAVIDVCIGSRGSAEIERKVKLRSDLQQRGLSVHCDYSDNMDTVLTPDFLQQNSVVALVELSRQEDRNTVHNCVEQTEKFVTWKNLPYYLAKLIN